MSRASEVLDKLSEVSFSKGDIPKSFKVVIDIGHEPEKAIKELSDGVLKGVKGISSSGRIIWSNLGVARDAFLVMPGKETVELNKLSRYMYDNPNYFFSKSMHHLKRLFQKESNQQGALRNVTQYLFSVFVDNGVFDKHEVSYTIPYQDLSYHPSAKSAKIDSVKDYIKWFRKASKGVAEEDRDFNRVFYSKIKEISDKELEKYIREVFEKYIYQIYGDEQEWEIKDEKLKIPKKSMLYILKEDISDKGDIWREFNKYTVERVEAIERNIEKYNLSSKMKIKYIEPSRWDKIQYSYFK